jgi:hypothetical protein
MQARTWTVHVALLACLLAVAVAAAQQWAGRETAAAQAGGMPAPRDGDALAPAAPGERYFVVLAGRSGLFYDESGPAFVMVSRGTGEGARHHAVGIYGDTSGRPQFGAVPPPAYTDLLAEPPDDSRVLLRVEVSRPAYERAYAILRTWDRRAREGMLLYPEIDMDNVLFVKQVTESLNEGTEHLRLYALDWSVEDHISEHHLPSQIPLQYFRELRRLNEDRHLSNGHH